MEDPGQQQQRPQLPLLKSVRFAALPPLLINITLGALALYVALTAHHAQLYPDAVVRGLFLLAYSTFLRLLWLLLNAWIQTRTAMVMVAELPLRPKQGGVNYRRRWYRRWHWWNRVGLLILLAQVVAACYIIKNNANIRHGRDERHLQILLRCLPWTALLVVTLGLCTGSEVFSWHLLYTRRIAWKAHYTEAFRCCIREALCCMGRYRYLCKEQKEEVCSVAELLGHLVTYRAEGCSHMEILAGVSLLHKDFSEMKNQSTAKVEKEDKSAPKKPAPDELLHEASILHPYAVASYTGPLLELGRYPYCWPFVWLYSQGLCSFWKRNRRPILKGDNLWRGHAAAFLRHSRLTREDGYIRTGRVLQTKRETAYFVVVLHKLRTVVVAVRGTETPEDLLTDGMSRETPLSKSDLLGVLEGPEVLNEVEGKTHYAHSGIIEAARELSFQLDKLAEDDDDAMAASDLASIAAHKEEGMPQESARKGGLLTELFGPKGDCKGYQLRLVGHSLGGSICALTGLRLYRRYPNLHVYAFGALPCVDDVIAEACQKFITSVVYQDEFSSRLSVASLMRLRVNVETALKDSIKTSKNGENSSSGSHSGEPSLDKEYSDLNKLERVPYMLKGGLFLCAHACFCIFKMSKHHKATALTSEVERHVTSISSQQHNASQWQCLGNGGYERESMTRLVANSPALFALTGANENKGFEVVGNEEDGEFVRVNLEPSSNGPLRTSAAGSGFFNSSDREAGGNLLEIYPSEMYLPGQVLHIVRTEDPAHSWPSAFRNTCKAECQGQFQAFVVDRNEFQNVVISSSMFVDHMPWKCQYALNSIVEARRHEGKLSKSNEPNTSLEDV